MAQPTVLVVEDEQALADLYAAWLADEYRVRTAYDGETALDHLDDEVDVVVLDRRMPDLSGDKVLVEIHEQRLGCRVAMVTGVVPGFDIVEMGFDDYLVKPISREELVERVENLVALEAYDDAIQRLYQVAAAKAVLERNKTPLQLDNSDEYRALVAEFNRIRSRTDAMPADLLPTDILEYV